MSADTAHLEATIELLEERLQEAVTFPEDVGWAKLTSGGTSEAITRDELLATSRRARVMAVADPLIRRAVSLRVSYVHGQGVTVAAVQEEDDDQDVNAVVQAFLKDPGTREVFSSQQAREECERRFNTQGEQFLALPTSPLTGRVQTRLIPQHEVTEVITDPEDAATPWFYRRVWTATVVESGTIPGTTRNRRETRKRLYPALGFRPATRPRALDGVPIEWDTPVLHTAVNRVDGQRWGVPDMLAALPWALGYKEALEDWARLIKALSRIAFRASSRNRTSARTALNGAAADMVGGTVVMGEGDRLEAVSKSGATIDAGSFRPIAAMVASATDVPVTMLLGDPGVTGARATAETLDDPLRLDREARQELHASMYRQVLDYVIDQSVKAPRGLLRGRVIRDPYTGREVVTLEGDQARQIDVTWPPLDKVSPELVIKAIVDADATGKLPPLVVARLLLVALDVDNVDAILEELVDEDGNWLDPDDAAQARSQQAAVRRGDLPPAEGGPNVPEEPAEEAA